MNAHRRRDGSLTLVLTITLVLIGLRPGTLAGQARLDLRLGGGWGPIPGVVMGATGRSRVAGPFSASLAAERIAASSACDSGVALGGVGCGYEGFSVSVGGEVASVDLDRFYVAPGVNAGGFKPSSYSGASWASMLGVSIDGAYRAWGPMWLHLGVAHRRIFDDAYHDDLGEFPHYTSVTVGAGFQLGR